MVSVSCPRCQGRQDISEPGAPYECRGCGTAWTFVTCSRCASRFHAAQGVSVWTCPNCHTAHGDLKPPAWSSPSARRMLAGGAALLALVIVAAVVFRPHDAGTSTSVSPRASSAPSLDQLTQKLCTDIQGLQELRFDALGRLGKTLEADRQAFADAGDQKMATDIAHLITAVGKLQDTTSAGGDPSEATGDLLKALGPLPC